MSLTCYSFFHGLSCIIVYSHELISKKAYTMWKFHNHQTSHMFFEIIFKNMNKGTCYTSKIFCYDSNGFLELNEL